VALKGQILSNHVSNLIQTKKIGSQIKKAILMYMADKASDDGTGIWVSKANMAADLEMTDRAVRKHIKEMVAMSILREAGQRKCKAGYTVDYAINLVILANFPSTRTTPEHGSPLNDIHPTPCTPFTPTPEHGSDKPSLEPSIEPNTSSNDDELDYYFEELWVWYPRKVGKGQAKKALKAALKKVSFDEIYHPLVAYVETLDDKDKQFIPHLATWLNGERWADEE
jgi:hypothetical protein